MANFVSLQNAIPDSEDDVEFLYAAADGTARVGLWGFKDGSSNATVRVIAGPGTATFAGLATSAVQVWTFSGLTAASRIQAFSGIRPFTEVLEVRMAGPAGTLGSQNIALLGGSDPAERASIGGNFVPTVPLQRAIGDNAAAPKMGTIRGLSVHVTTGANAPNSLKNDWEQRGASAHFAIGRGGDIYQYVAASIKAQAQGAGNTHFLSVELVGLGHNDGSCQEMTALQLITLRQLWVWVRSQHPRVPNRLARAYSGMGKPLSTKLTPLFRDMALSLSAMPYCAGDSNFVHECIESMGLSCHYWLDTGIYGGKLVAKPCPGIGIIGQLPEVIAQPRVRVAGDAAFILP